MTPLLAMGIDPSTSATGIVLLRESGEPRPALEMETEIKAPDLTGIERNRYIVTRIMETIHEHRPDKIVVEGYSLNMKNASSVVPLVELGGLLRFMLHIDRLVWYDPRASELKKFVVGKGTADKAQMMMHVLKRWGHESATSNIADAYGLACMGLAQANRLPGINKEMRAIAGAMVSRTN